MVWHSLGNAKNCERFDLELEEQEKEKKKGLKSGSTCPNMGIVKTERNKMAFKGIESSFSQLIRNLCFLIFFWCKQKVCCYIDDLVVFVEHHIM